jgi:sulfate adenylyltransferase
VARADSLQLRRESSNRGTRSRQPGDDSTGAPFYAPEAARELVEQFSAELAVRVVPFSEMVYLPEEGRYEERDRVPSWKRIMTLLGTQVRDSYLNRGTLLPSGSRIENRQ